MQKRNSIESVYKWVYIETQDHSFTGLQVQLIWMHSSDKKTAYDYKYMVLLANKDVRLKHECFPKLALSKKPNFNTFESV